MSDAWQEIQAIKNKRNSLREKLEKRKKARQDILVSSLGSSNSSPVSSFENASSTSCSSLKEETKIKTEPTEDEDLVKIDPELEKEVLKCLDEVTLQLPYSSLDLVASLKITLNRHISHRLICNLLQKFATQKLISVKENVKDGNVTVDVTYVEHTKLNAMVTEATTEIVSNPVKEESLKRKCEDSPDKKADDDEKKKKEKRDPRATDIFVSF